MHLDDDEFFYTLDGLAAKAWLLIDGKRSWDSIQRELMDGDRNMPEKRLLKDLVKLAEHLKKAALIR